MAKDWRQKIHLEPRTGWLNDPNGLCFADGKYHVYFQYSPDSPSGAGRKCWAHFVSIDDARSWEYTGIVMEPDIPEDRSGVYSGCAVVKDGTIHLFYTGNVKIPGDYDYVTAGREANQIHVTTKDGHVMSPKKVILRNCDYPEYCSCHVRDPKVWIENGKWKMVLGARTLDDKGCVLCYEADDPDEWHYVKTLMVEDFGYMWECPDQFDVDGRTFLGISPQGLPHGEYTNQNVYSSGYFRMEDGKLTDFREFDLGFDFYAPQTFVNEYDERILIGWMGIGDIPYTNPTTELGWQHCLTVPRKLSLTEDGHIRQWPVINHNLYGLMTEVAEGAEKLIELPCDIVSVINGDFYTISIDDAVITYNGRELILDLSKGDIGSGRTVRKALIGKLSDIRIIADRSSLEIFASGGRYVMSTRFYPADTSVKIVSEGGGYIFRAVGEMEVRRFG